MKSGSKAKTLNFEKPLVGLYPHISNVMAMYGNNEYIMPSLISEMMGMVYDRELNRLDFSISLEILQYMNNYPLMYNHGISRNVVANKWKKYSDFLIDMIDEGYYVHNLLDTYYMSAYGETYGKEHYRHNSMVYGYDVKNQIFVVADAFEKGVYETKAVSFGEINQAFINTYVDDWLDGIRLYKLKEDPFVGLGYNCKYIGEQCRKYLECEMPVCATYMEHRRRIDLEDRFCHGIKIYDEVINYLKTLEYTDITWESADIRIFYGLYDHINVYGYLIKQLMQRKQIISSDELYRQYRQLRDRIKNIYMLVIKYNVTGKRRIIDDLTEKLEMFKNDEEKFVRDFTGAITFEDEELTETLEKPSVITCDSIMLEYDDEEKWIRKSISEEVRYTDEPAAWVKCQFCGNKIIIKIRTNEKYGRGMVLIDGEEKRKIDYSDTDVNEVIIETISYGYHVMELRNISEGKTINIESVEVWQNNTKEQNMPEDTSKTVFENISGAERVYYKRNTGGALIDDFGFLGYDIVCGDRKLPSFMTLCNYRIEKAVNVLLMHNTAGGRGVRKERGKKNSVAAYALSDKEFSLEITIPGREKNVTLYFVDYDNLARSQKLVVENADTGEVYDICEIEGFTNGTAVSYRVKGHIRFRIIRVSGPDAVLSAVYFDR